MRYPLARIPVLVLVALALALAGFLPVGLAAQESTPGAAADEAYFVVRMPSARLRPKS